MKNLARIIKLVFGWGITVLCSIVLLDLIFNGEKDGFDVFIIFVFLDLLGVLLLRSAKKDKITIQEEEKNTFYAVECPFCGASTKIEKGKPGICEYCGSAIEYSLKGTFRGH